MDDKRTQILVAAALVCVLLAVFSYTGLINFFPA